jgi:hypothetical protein
MPIMEILHYLLKCLGRVEEVLFGFQELLPTTVEFLQNRSNLTPQLKDTWRSLDLAILLDLTTKLNMLNTDLQAENTIIIKITGTVIELCKTL